MTDTRTFPTSDVLSVTTGVLLSQSIGAVYEVCGYILDDTLMTHQLPNASRACTPHLVALHPWLADLEPPRGDIDALLLWLGEVEHEHGATLQVVPAVDPQWVRGNAIQDLVDLLRPGTPVIPVVIYEDLS